jgi:signal transduction histidine kinase
MNPSRRSFSPLEVIKRGLDLLRPNAEPGALYRRVRLLQAFLPILIILVVIGYQTIVVRLDPRRTIFWLEMLFYGILGPLATFFSIGWISSEVQVRERAEADLRDLYLELSESHRRLAEIQKVTRSVSEAQDIGAVLEAAIQGLVSAVGASAGAIMLEGGVVRSVTLEPLPPEVFDLEPLRDIWETLERPSGWVGATNRLSLPLRWGERFLGATHLYFAGMPSAESKELLEILVGELSVAIEAAQARTRDLLTLFEVDRSIRAESNLERLLEAVLVRIRDRVSAQATAVYLTDDENHLTLAWGRDSSGNVVRAGFEHGYVVGKLAQAVSVGRSSLLVNDLEHSEMFDLEDSVLTQSKAAIGLPLLADSELVGVIVLGHDKANAFDARELPLLGLLANQVTLAVRNAKAYLYSEELAIFDERNRIAREIHDGIAQSLAFTAMKLDLASRLLERDPTRVQTELETAKNTLREQIKEVRRSIFALRPIDLERLGFLETIKGYVKDFGEQNRVQATLEIVGEPQLSPTNEAVMFRILQEALNNVAKHSKAKTVNVSLRVDSSGTRLGISDDGVGFDPEALTGVVSSVGGLGLQQMRERLQARGGQFEFRSSVGAGTRVTAVLP